MSQTFRSFRYFGKEYTFDEWVREDYEYEPEEEIER